MTYQEPCHLVHAQRISRQPRELLAAIPGLELVEMKESSLCCGSAGIYNIIREEMANELGDRKALHAMETPATEVITANPGLPDAGPRFPAPQRQQRPESATSPICSTRPMAERRRSAPSSAAPLTSPSELFEPIDIVPDHGEARPPETGVTAGRYRILRPESACAGPAGRGKSAS